MIQNAFVKNIEIKEGENKYKCQLQTIKDFLLVSLYQEDNLKFEGNIHISKIQNQIGAFRDYNNKEIFEEINFLNSESFNLIKEANKYKLKIKFLILRKEKFICLDLNGNEDIKLNNQDLIKTILELKETIKVKDDKIKSLEEELDKYKQKNNNLNNNDISYNNFDIKLKEPKHIIKYHISHIYCSTVLSDGRYATGSQDYSIIIYNNKTFTPDIIIREHNNIIYCLNQLISGILASGSVDKKINLYNINGNEYNLIQTLFYHTDAVTKIIELNNAKLVSCSSDKSIIFYSKYNNEYIKGYSIKTNGYNGELVQIKENEICFIESDNNAICFFDLLERKVITRIINLILAYTVVESLILISKDLLLATGTNKLTIININYRGVQRIIEVSGSDYIYTACLLNENILLTADCNHRIIQWKIEDDNLKLISKKENAHDSGVYTIKKLGNGLIVSGDCEGTVKVW